MPQWNECGIYNEACRNKTCDHPANPLREAAKSVAETNVILSVTRDECRGSTGSVSDEQTTEVQEPIHTLIGLSDDDCSLLVQALYALNDHATRGKTYDACMAMVDRIYEIY